MTDRGADSVTDGTAQQTGQSTDPSTPAKVGIVGAGVMGRSIAAVFAATDHECVLVDVAEDALDAAGEYHETAAEGQLREADYDLPTSGSISDSISYSTDTQALSAVEFVLETVTEDLEVKRSVMDEVSEVVDSEVPFGTNTSSLTAAEIAEAVPEPGRVVLFHFAKPAIARDLVEVAGTRARDEVLGTAEEVATGIGKQPIRLERERRGNGLSRLSAAIKAAATWELARRDPETVDRAARAVGFDQGPIELIDAIGLDVHLATVDNLHEEYGDRFDPPETLRETMETRIEKGRLGQKTGGGFLTWEGDEVLIPDGEGPTEAIEPVLAALVNEAYRMVEDGIAPQDRIDRLFKLGSGGAVGPFDIESMLGTEHLRDVLEERHAATGSPLYEPAAELGE